MEDGNKLLKTCVQKMNQGVFLDGQWKVILGQKRKRKLAIKLEKEDRKRKVSAGEERALAMSFVAALRRCLLLITFYSSGFPSLRP